VNENISERKSLNPFDDSSKITTNSFADEPVSPTESNKSERSQAVRRNFLNKLHKIEKKMKKGEFDREEVALLPSDENGIIRFLVDARGILTVMLQ
jgi:hypothetical protein